MDNTCIVKSYSTTAMLNQRRMLADPFEVILRNMRRTAEGLDHVDIDAIRDEYGIDPLSEEFNDCRMS